LLQGRVFFFAPDDRALVVFAKNKVHIAGLVEDAAIDV
jgi:hypothetical protein